MFIFPPSGSGCDLEFGSFELQNPLICVYNKNVRPNSDCQTSRPLSDCCGGSKHRRQARGAPGRSIIYTRSVYVHRAAEPSSPAFPAPRRTHVLTANQVACVQFDVAAARTQQRAARKNLLQFFPGRWKSLYSSLLLYRIVALFCWQVFYRAPQPIRSSLTIANAVHKRICFDAGIR